MTSLFLNLTTSLFMAPIMTTNDTVLNDTVLLITKDPSHPLAHLGLRYAHALLANKQADAANNSQSLSVQSPSLSLFFYGDGAHIANRLRWQSADQSNLTQAWQALAKQHDIALPVCVSTALSRGISDEDNSLRHQLTGDNVAAGFELVGLSDFALMLQSNCRLIPF